MHGFQDAPRRRTSVTIDNGETESGILDTLHYKIAGFHFDAAFDGTTVTFKAAKSQADAAADNFLPVHDDAGTQVSVTTAASRSVPMTSEASALALAAFRFLKLVADSQTGATVIDVELVN